MTDQNAPFMITPPAYLTPADKAWRERHADDLRHNAEHMREGACDDYVYTAGGRFVGLIGIAGDVWIVTGALWDDGRRRFQTYVGLPADHPLYPVSGREYARRGALVATLAEAGLNVSGRAPLAPEPR